MDRPFLDIFLIIVLIILNGIFSAGEIAIVSSRKSKIKEMMQNKKDMRTERLLAMKENPERFLSAVQIGITLFGTLASAIGGIISVKYIKPFLSKIPFVGAFDDTISLVFVVVVMTYFFLVFGELLPKYIGIHHKERIALWIMPLIEFTSRILAVFVNILSLSAMFFVNSLNLKKGEDQISEGEIRILLEEGRRKGIFDETEEKLINGVFKFADRSVKEIMVPRPNIYSINLEDSPDEILKYIVENEFSRYPVYKGSLDSIVGLVYHKDIAKQIWLKNPVKLEKILKKPYFIPDTMEISLLLKEMQKRRQHIAIVVDEYGTTVGIVTLEDIMEEIFGEIMDETDVDDRIERLKDGSFIVDASYSVRDLNIRLDDINIPESPDYETLGGFLLSRLQDVARGGEMIDHGMYRFIVVGVEGIRITKIKLEKFKKRQTA